MDIEEIPLPEGEKPLKPKRKPRVKLLAEDGDEVSAETLKVKKPKKEKAPPKTAREVFEIHLKGLNLEELKKPWMATKAFRLIDDADKLQAWADKILADKSRWKTVARTGELMPVIAVDTETIGMDTRRVRGVNKIPIAGICLSADGVEGIYVPINHESSANIDKERCRQILQSLFDQSLIVFYNAKFDREVLRFNLHLKLRSYPYFEDVQVMKYLVDPKADLGDKKKYLDSGGFGLKALSKNELNIDQIHLDTLTKIKVTSWNPSKGKNTTKTITVPFTWLPTDIALWYAAGDAIATWLLWERFVEEARSIKVPHKVDHELVDALSWVERQRFHVDVPRLRMLATWHQKKLDVLSEKMQEMTGIQDFNPGSTAQLVEVLFKQKGFKPLRVSEKTKVPSTDADTLEYLTKEHPEDEFLKTLMDFRTYAALHPANLNYDPDDHTARIFLKQNVVSGGRLAAAGGEDFEVDGGMGLNVQAIVSVSGNWWIRGRRLLDQGQYAEQKPRKYNVEEIHPSCVKHEKEGIVLAPNIRRNHIGTYFDQKFCLVPSCTECECEKESETDANEVLNLRSLFCAVPGWTFFCTDYSNIEMRVAANCSGETKFIDEFITGSGDFHSLTASIVFPEFNHPIPKDADEATVKALKARKKKLRGMAKTLNFALLYGGSAYTVSQQLGISFEEADEMVAKYWEGVPYFSAWAEKQRELARKKMICRTKSGRIIKFDSAMKAQRITLPEQHEWDNYKIYWDIRRRAKDFEKTDKEKYQKIMEKADAMYKDRATGVRNLSDYKSFMSKVLRVVLNIPLQGLAGDIMRMSLNRLHTWSRFVPKIWQVLEVHASVHDELDYTVRDEFVPWVLPRFVKLMKLRPLHEKMKWPVAIECDTEYGSSWDLRHHLTGDDTHLAAGWTKIPLIAEYVPVEFDENTPKHLIKSLQNDAKRDKALTWLKENLHARTKPVLDSLKEQLGKGCSTATLKQLVYAILQIHEFWVIDSAPDFDTDGFVEFETLEQYAERIGVQLDASDMTLDGELTTEVLVNIAPIQPEPLPLPVKEQKPEEAPSTPQAVSSDDDVNFDPPEPEQKENTAVVTVPNLKLSSIDSKESAEIQELRPDADPVELRSLLGIGKKKCKFIFKGTLQVVANVGRETLPPHLLLRGDAASV